MLKRLTKGCRYLTNSFVFTANQFQVKNRIPLCHRICLSLKNLWSLKIVNMEIHLLPTKCHLSLKRHRSKSILKQTLLILHLPHLALIYCLHIRPIKIWLTSLYLREAVVIWRPLVGTLNRPRYRWQLNLSIRSLICESYFNFCILLFSFFFFDINTILFWPKV